MRSLAKCYCHYVLVFVPVGRPTLHDALTLLRGTASHTRNVQWMKLCCTVYQIWSFMQLCLMQQSCIVVKRQHVPYQNSEVLMQGQGNELLMRCLCPLFRLFIKMANQYIIVTLECTSLTPSLTFHSPTLSCKPRANDCFVWWCHLVWRSHTLLWNVHMHVFEWKIITSLHSTCTTRWWTDPLLF